MYVRAKKKKKLKSEGRNRREKKKKERKKFRAEVETERSQSASESPLASTRVEKVSAEGWRRMKLHLPLFPRREFRLPARYERKMTKNVHLDPGSFLPLFPFFQLRSFSLQRNPITPSSIPRFKIQRNTKVIHDSLVVYLAQLYYSKHIPRFPGEKHLLRE